MVVQGQWEEAVVESVPKLEAPSILYQGLVDRDAQVFFISN